MHESDTLEWKREFVKELKKTFVAFANTDGGTILIGVDDEGKTIGLDNPDAVMQQVINCIKDNVRPDLAPFFKCETIEHDGKHIVRVRIVRGSRRPYYIADKGVRPEGVYIRKGPESIQASEDQILEFIAEANEKEYELQTSLEQNLTFEYASKVFFDKGIEFSDNKKKTLRLMDLDGFYSNLGLLLSDQCPFTIKFALFSYDRITGAEIFIDRAEVAGSVLKQLDFGAQWLREHNRVSSTFKGMERIDHFDFPTKSLREALMNAIIHREYGLSGPIIVNLFPNRLEIISIGGLVRGMSIEDMFNGISRPRNVYLADIFTKLRFVEGWGTGIRNIKIDYIGNARQPEFNVAPHSFRVVLPMIDKQAAILGTEELLSRTASAILDHIRKSQGVTREALQISSGLSSSAIIKALSELLKFSLIRKERSGRKFIYTWNDGDSNKNN